MDVEKGPIVTTTATSESTTTTLDPLKTYQTLVGDIDSPIDSNDNCLYHSIIVEERKARQWFIITAIIIYIAIAAQIVLCLGITVGAQRGLGNNQISILAAVNTGVAATIGVLKALGLPDKKSIERRALQGVAERIRLTTKKLRLGLTVDAAKEADEVRQTFNTTEDAAIFSETSIQAAADIGLGGVKGVIKKH